MANPYVLRYSNPFKPETVIVPTASTGSGINNYDTSLSLIGPGYANYGYAYAQNFLHLLENFASPYAPENPIEGQLWYDTSDPVKKILRVANGTDTSSRWPAASGIYQQFDDPYIQYRETIKEGDIWVDIANGQVKVRTGDEWKIVGPSISSGIDKTGSEATTASSTTDVIYPIIKNWVNGKVVEIISYNAFTPKQVIDGFSNILTGTNLTTKVNAKYNGVSLKSESLIVTGNTTVRASELLRNRATVQIHTGTFIVNAAEGLFVKNATYNHSIQLNSDVNGAKLFFNDDTKIFKIGIENWSWATFDPNKQMVGINTSTNANVPDEVSLNVYGGARFSNTVTIGLNASNALVVTGGINLGGNASIGTTLSVSGISTLTGRVIVGSNIGQGLILDPGKDDVYDIGSVTRRFRRIYASVFGTTSTSVFNGTLNGPATQLASYRNFSITGQVATTGTISFNGNANVIFTATLQRSSIDSQPTTNTATSTYSLLVLDTSTSNTNLEKISKANFLKDVYDALVPRGSILPLGSDSTSSVFPYFLLCNGTEYDTTGPYQPLFNTIGYKFNSSSTPGGYFKLPNMTTTTYVVTGTNTGTYLSYIIKT